jgi:alpha-L-rhamnosidase
MRAASWLLFGGLLLASPVTAQERSPPGPDRVERRRTNATPEALGIDTPKPRLSWALASGRRGVLQTAYRVTVGSRPELTREGAADVWDSGRMESSDPFVIYGGPKLRSRTRYYWSVSVWATGGFAAEASPTTWFETAFFEPSEWRGEWIAGPERRTTLFAAGEGEADDAEIRARGEFCRPVGWILSGFSASKKNDQGECREIRPTPMLRKSFHVTRPVARARVYSSGLAYNRLTINGVAASRSVLDPGFTNYSKTVLYTTTDVTELLRQGENVVATELGSGRYDDAARSWDWGWEAAEWRATPRVRLDLYVTYTDGTEELVRSDGSWKVSTEGPRRYDSLFLGETYDARREIPGWDQPGFDDSRWTAARVVDGPTGVLRAQVHQPIRVVDMRSTGKRSQPSPGVIVYDVGQNLTGWAELKVRAAAGTAVEVFYSEKLDKHGRASAEGNFLVYGQLQTDDYVARGAGDEVWTPVFSYKGFQYVQISGPGGQPLPADAAVSIERIHQVRSDLPRTSRFESSQPTLERLHGNTAWAVQSNLHGIVTDTPVYEKNAWTGDAALTAGTASLLFDTERLYRKMFQDMRDAQTAEGELSLLCPSNRNYGYLGKPFFKPVDCCGATPAWDAFWFVIPWESYRRYGDAAALEAVYPTMRRYLDVWIPRWTDKDGDIYPQTLTSGLGDWLSPEGVPTLNALVSTAYYAHLVRIASQAARVLGRTDDAARYEGLFEKIRADFNARFLSPAGFYREKDSEPFTQSAQILPFAFGLVPEERRAALVARLADDIAARGGNPYVGVLGARYILPVLTAAGRHDVAFTVATQTDEPSWGYWTDVLGFTALGESWPAATRSRNHHFFGAIVDWFYEELAGIRPLEPGYRKIEVRPEIPAAGLDRVAATYESVRGEIASAWRRTPGGLELDVTIPANATARVVLPAQSAQDVHEIASGRRRRAEHAPSVRLVAAAGGRVIYEIGSGRYQFRIAR